MSKREAKLVVIFAPVLLLAFWLIEFVGVLDGHVGGPITLTAKIRRCEGIDQSRGWLKWEKKKVTLVFDAADRIAVRFTRPKRARPAIIALCRSKGRVQAIYQTWKPLLRDQPRHKLLGITDLKQNKVVFTPEDYNAWKKYNRLWGYAVAGFAFLAMAYAILVLNGAIRRGSVAELKRKVRGHHRGRFLIRSSQRRIEAVIYLVLFVGLLSIFLYYYLFKQGSVWLVLFGLVPLIGIYAYLVELVNVNQLFFKDDALFYRHGPLPWVQRRRTFPQTQVVSLIAEEEVRHSRHGPYTLYSVAVELTDGTKETLFFTNGYEEAEAITVLVNERLGERSTFAQPGQPESAAAPK